ncbi:uncharacterized protein MEPE_02254 [Melanopsichium pennsylvanicum]|uniref:Uncharacterized protein n=2 Tax=Melanopsichium pennsylvanicum TaxID=63383 RepID=A0AAJ4XKC2_9BASI|nr:putative protein [Melanopsichium pennsylvanicum 4]SNX83547.1 uncharacterized protein MEPE_02254 [Melanopsichium pennsylvanicum]
MLQAPQKQGRPRVISDQWPHQDSSLDGTHIVTMDDNRASAARKLPQTAANFFVGTNSRVPRMTLAQSSHIMPLPSIKPPVLLPTSSVVTKKLQPSPFENSPTSTVSASSTRSASRNGGKVAKVIRLFSNFAEEEEATSTESSETRRQPLSQQATDKLSHLENLESFASKREPLHPIASSDTVRHELAEERSSTFGSLSALAVPEASFFYVNPGGASKEEDSNFDSAALQEIVGQAVKPSTSILRDAFMLLSYEHSDALPLSDSQPKHLANTAAQSAPRDFPVLSSRISEREGIPADAHVKLLHNPAASNASGTSSVVIPIKADNYLSTMRGKRSPSLTASIRTQSHTPDLILEKLIRAEQEPDTVFNDLMTNPAANRFGSILSMSLSESPAQKGSSDVVLAHMAELSTASVPVSACTDSSTLSASLVSPVGVNFVAQDQPLTNANEAREVNVGKKAAKEPSRGPALIVPEQLPVTASGNGAPVEILSSRSSSSKNESSERDHVPANAVPGTSYEDLDRRANGVNDQSRFSAPTPGFPYHLSSAGQASSHGLSHQAQRSTGKEVDQRTQPNLFNVENSLDGTLAGDRYSEATEGDDEGESSWVAEIVEDAYTESRPPVDKMMSQKRLVHINSDTENISDAEPIAVYRQGEQETACIVVDPLHNRMAHNTDKEHGGCTFRPASSTSSTEDEILSELIDEVGMPAPEMEHIGLRESLIARTTNWIKSTMMESESIEKQAVELNNDAMDLLLLANPNLQEVAAEAYQDEMMGSAVEGKSLKISLSLHALDDDVVSRSSTGQPDLNALGVEAKDGIIGNSAEPIASSSKGTGSIAMANAAQAMGLKLSRSYSQYTQPDGTTVKQVKKLPGRLKLPQLEPELATRSRRESLELPAQRRKKTAQAHCQETPAQRGREASTQGTGALQTNDFSGVMRSSSRSVVGEEVAVDGASGSRYSVRQDVTELHDVISSEDEEVASVAVGKRMTMRRMSDFTVHSTPRRDPRPLSRRFQRPFVDSGPSEEAVLRAFPGKFRQRALAEVSVEEANARPLLGTLQLPALENVSQEVSSPRALPGKLRRQSAEPRVAKEPRPQALLGKVRKNAQEEVLTEKPMLWTLPGRVKRQVKEDSVPREPTLRPQPAKLSQQSSAYAFKEESQARPLPGKLPRYTAHGKADSLLVPASLVPQVRSSTINDTKWSTRPSRPANSNSTSGECKPQEVMAPSDSIGSADGDDHQRPFSRRGNALPATGMESHSLRLLRLHGYSSATNTPKRPAMSVSNTSPRTVSSELWTPATSHPANSVLTDETCISRSDGLRSRSHLRHQAIKQPIKQLEAVEKEARIRFDIPPHSRSNEQQSRHGQLQHYASEDQNQANNFDSSHAQPPRVHPRDQRRSNNSSGQHDREDGSEHLRVRSEMTPLRVSRGASAPGFELSFQLQEPKVAPHCPDGTLFEFGLRVLIRPTSDDPSKCPWRIRPPSRLEFDVRLPNSPPVDALQYEYNHLPVEEMSKVQEEAQAYLLHTLPSPQHRREGISRLLPAFASRSDDCCRLSLPLSGPGKTGPRSSASTKRPHKEMILATANAREASALPSAKCSSRILASKMAAATQASPMRRRAPSSGLASLLPYIKRATPRAMSSGFPVYS